MMTELSRKYPVWIPLAIMPATGWHAVYVGQDGKHYAWAIQALALVQEEIRDLYTGVLLQEVDTDNRTLRGMDYNPSDGWEFVEMMDSCCGLLPPDWTLAEFEAGGHCRHTRLAKGEEDA